MKNLLLMILVIMLLASCALADNAQPEPEDFSTLTYIMRFALLRDIGGIWPAVYAVNMSKDDPLQKYYDQEALTVAVESRLRGAAIPLKSFNDYIKSKAKVSPYIVNLTVKTNAFTTSTDAIAYSLDIRAERKCVLMVSGKPVEGAATVWSDGGVGICPKEQFADVIRNTVSKIMDNFCNDLLKANPKTPPNK